MKSPWNITGKPFEKEISEKDIKKEALLIESTRLDYLRNILKNTIKNSNSLEVDFVYEVDDSEQGVLRFYTDDTSAVVFIEKVVSEENESLQNKKEEYQYVLATNKSGQMTITVSVLHSVNK